MIVHVRVLKSCFNVYVLTSLEYFVNVRMSSAKSHLVLQDSIVHRAEKLCEREFCYLRHREKVSALCLLYKIYRRVDHSIYE